MYVLCNKQDLADLVRAQIQLAEYSSSARASTLRFGGSGRKVCATLGYAAHTNRCRVEDQ